MAETGDKIYDKHARVSVMAGCLAVIVVGLSILLITTYGLEDPHLVISRVVSQHLGGFFVGAAALALFWEAFSRSAFLVDILRKAGISRAVQDAGILGATTDFGAPPWESYFEHSSCLDIFFANGGQWEDRVGQPLNRFLADPKKTLRLVLPDASNETVVAAVAERNQCIRPAEQGQKILAAYARWGQRFKASKNTKHTILCSPVAPRYTLYMFDNVAIVSLYTYRRETESAWPLVICEVGGELYKALALEFKAVVARSEPLCHPGDAASTPEKVNPNA